MKDSGVEWLGEVLEHWKITKLKHAVSQHGGSTPSKENLDYWDGDIPWVTAKDMKREFIGDSIDHVTEAAIRETNLSVLPKEVVLLVVRGMILAHSVPVALTMVETTINQDIKAMIANKAVNSDYLLLLLQGMKDAIFQFVDNMTTQLAGKDTCFLPFNQGTAEGGAGNPPAADAHHYAISYLWQKLFQPDAWLQVLGRFLHLQQKTSAAFDGTVTTTETLIFPAITSGKSSPT